MLKNPTLNKMFLSGLISITAITASVASAVEVKLYAYKNHTAYMETITNVGNHRIPHNELTSIKVSEGYGVILWDDYDFEDKLLTLHKTADLKYTGYDNRTNAITVFKLYDEVEECEKDEWNECIDPKDPDSIEWIDWSDISYPSVQVDGTTGEVINCKPTEVTVIVKGGFFDSCVKSGDIINIAVDNSSSFSQWSVVNGSGEFESINTRQTKLLVESSNGTTLTVKPY